MKTLIKISWRNVWRNKARSIVIILATGFGLWGGIFATALMSGMIQQQFDSSIRNQVSHIQIHNPEFVKEKQAEYSIHNAKQITDFIENNEKVFSYAERTLVSGMLATASMTSGVELYGIYKSQEEITTSFKDNLIEGDYFESISRNPVIIGKSLADKMNISIGNRIILTFQDLNGDITSAAFRVCGIYQTSNSMNDGRNVFVKNTDLAALIGSDDIVNEIAILLHNIDNVNAFSEELNSRFSGNEVRTWYHISPDLSFMNEFSGMALMILLIIILFALAFGLLNTMLMTIFERTRELGVLMSVGMSKLRVFTMILLETSFLVVIGSVFGTIIGALTVALTSRRGIDLSGFGAEAMSEFGFDSVIYPTLDNMFYLNLAILVLITAILSAVYPARKALKLNPADAVRKE